MIENLEEALKVVKTLCLDYFKPDRYGNCNCEWCVINRSIVRPEKLIYLMKLLTEAEEFETCINIQREFDSRRNINFTEEYRNNLKEKKREIYLSK